MDYLDFEMASDLASELAFERVKETETLKETKSVTLKETT